MEAARNILVMIGIDGLVSKAFSLINQEFSFTWSVKVHIQRLAEKLEKIQALLPDAERKSNVPWLKRVADVSSETDNLLRECAYENHRLKAEVKVKKLKKVLNTFSSSNNSVIVRTKMICRIKRINSKLDKICYESSLSELVPVKNTDGSNVELGETSQSRDSRMIESEVVGMREDLEVESQVVGMSKDLEVIKEQLINSCNDQDLAVVSIVGMPGIGKTTLAQLVYNDVEVDGSFDERMWICVPPDFNVVGLLKMMLENLTHTVLDFDVNHRKVFVYKLLERLKGKKFLLVLDDVRNQDSSKWDSFMESLLRVGGSRGSKVLVTTRLTSDAHVWVSCFVHPMRHQTDESNWYLFDKIVFAEGGPRKTKTLEILGKKIVERCGGNPLAVKVIAGMMYLKKAEAEWRKIAEDDEVRIPGISNIQMLPYDRLPSLSLKQCFAYSSIFPKDSVIQEEELVQLWMAVGFLNPPNGSSNLNMEDVGKMNLDILLQKSFLQNAEGDKFDDRKSCKMHDRLHDLASDISRDFCSIMKDIHIEDDFKGVHVTMINCTMELSKNSGGSFEKLRTLRLVDTSDLGDMLPYTKYLCALTVVNQQVKELPSSVGMLKHLQLLDISKTRIVRLPGSIAKLYSLQTLRLYDLQELPKNFENLVSLRYFYVENFRDLGNLDILPPKFQELINPSSFKASFKACLDDESRIEKLALLEHPDRYSNLKIYRLENVRNGKEACKAKLSEMARVEHLKLHWSGRRENCYDEDVLEGLKPPSKIKSLVIENFKGLKFSSWMMMTSEPLILNNLIRMELEDCCSKQIPPLGHLPRLKFVKIQGMDNVQHIGAEFFGSTSIIFPALRELSLLRMANLVEWSVAEHLLNASSMAFPLLEKFEVELCPKLIRLPNILNTNHRRLRRLEIALCNSLTSLPEGLQSLESLEDLEIRGLPSIPQLSIKRCNKLRSLTIGGFSSASLSQTSIHLKGGSGELKSLPKELEHFSTLRYLTIWGYDGLKTLPDWLKSFKSLQILKLEFCKSLEYFPSLEAIKQLKILVELNISYCPLLEERCTRRSREEWHKISHIPKIIINYEAIKSEY